MTGLFLFKAIFSISFSREKIIRNFGFWRGVMVSLIKEISPPPPPLMSVLSSKAGFGYVFGNFRPKVVVGKAPPLIVGTNTNLFQYPKWGVHSQVYQILP